MEYILVRDDKTFVFKPVTLASNGLFPHQRSNLIDISKHYWCQ